jgi:hypothetical protein
MDLNETLESVEVSMRRISYLKRATRRFLEGTKFKTPYEAVEAGALNLSNWSRLLAEEREIEEAYQRSRKNAGRDYRSIRVLSA